MQLTRSGHGEGYVIPRELPATIEKRSKLRTPLTVSKKGDDWNELPFRFPSYLIEAWIQRLDVFHSTQKFNAISSIRHSKPVVLLNTSFISNKASLFEDSKCDVYISKSSLSRFYIAEESKNVFGSRYYIKQLETSKTQMKLDEFHQSMNSWTQWRCLLKAPIQLSDDLAKDLRIRGLDGSWLLKYMQINDWPNLKNINLFQGSLNGVIPTSYQNHDSLVFVCEGKLRILVIPPDFAFNGLYPYPIHHPYDSYSMVDFDNVDLVHWPYFEKIRGQCCVLEEGEGLFVPQYCFFQIHVLQQGSSWVKIGLNSNRKLRSKDCIPLQVSRFVEQYGAMIEGIPHTRDWILKIAQRKALNSLNLGSVEGFKKLELIERILMEVKKNVGEDFGDYLTQICDERLLPTTWLNQDLQDPLYLKYKPIIIEDTRTNEQIKYPELFKHVL